jgi:hypothetical protein
MAADAGFEILNGKVVAETPFLRVEELNLQVRMGRLLPAAWSALEAPWPWWPSMVMTWCSSSSTERPSTEPLSSCLRANSTYPTRSRKLRLLASSDRGGWVYMADRWEQIALLQHESRLLRRVRHHLPRAGSDTGCHEACRARGGSGRGRPDPGSQRSEKSCLRSRIQRP